MRTFGFAVFLAALLLTAGAAYAQQGVIATVDENGNGTLVFAGGGTFAMPGVLRSDPGPGGLASALTYNLLGPPALVAGDVVLLETAALVGSDVIRFNPAGTGSSAYPASLVFYSDLAEGADALADTGFPSLLYTNALTLIEVGIEGANGVTYHPLSGQPGFVAGFDVTYVIQSDTAAVPEPASVLLVAMGGGLLVARRRWQKAISS